MNLPMIIRPIYPALVLAILALAGCRSARETTVVDVAAPTSPRPYLAGVDSTIARAATALADSSFVDRHRQEQAAGLASEGRVLVMEADSLLRVDEGLAFLKEPADSDTTSVTDQAAAVAAFNQGAQALKSFADEADSLQALALLGEAQDHFEQALRVNPFDLEARFWLSRVYTLRASRLGASEEHEQALGLLRRLAWMQQNEHGLFASLATTYEHLHEWANAGALWQRAAHTLLDDAALDPEGEHSADSSLLMNYYVRSERAYVEAGDSEAALRALDEAGPWAQTAYDHAFLNEERVWLLWDDGNLETRKTWDELLALSRSKPEAAVKSAEVLLGRVARKQARDEVRHRLGLLYYQTGEQGRAADTLKALWREVEPIAEGAESALAERVREDYGRVAYNLALAYYRKGDLRVALAYLLQSEKTGFGQAARAALEVALLLRNNVDEALEAARRAEARLGQLPQDEQKDLFRYMVELYRRKGDREQALRYVQKYRTLAPLP